MSFLWSHVLEPGKPTSFSFTRPLVIRNASLGHGISDTKSRTSVQIRYTELGVEKATFLCSLVPGKFEQFSLYVTLDAGVHYIAEIIGKNAVYLIGAYTETDHLPDMSAPMAACPNMHTLLPPGSTTASQDISENVRIPSSEPPIQPAAIESSIKKKAGHVSKVSRAAPAASRMVTRSTTGVGTRSKVTAKISSAATSGTSGEAPMQHAFAIKDVPIMPAMPTLPSLAVEPAPPNDRVGGLLSPLKATLEVTPLDPTDNLTTTIPRANTLVSHPSKSINASYNPSSSAFSTSFSNLWPTAHKTASSPDVLHVPAPPPPAQSSPVYPSTSGDLIIDSSPSPTQPTYVCVRDLKVGAGSLVRPQSTVYVRYRGKVGDTKGPVFAENVNGPLFKFRVGGPEVFPGFSDGVIGMAKGGKRTMFVPPAFGFGSQGNDRVPPNSPLVIECEVVEID